MDAKEASLLRFLDGNKQFVVPIYQRPYSWEIDECRQLWDDIIRISADESIPGYFIGSIVYVSKGLYQVTTTPQLLLIDGQQRLATVSLMLHALGKTVAERGDKTQFTKEELNDLYLLNKHCHDDLRYRLLLNRQDKDTYISVIEDREPPSSPSPRIMKNYQYIREMIGQSKLDLGKIYRGLQRLIIIDVSLERTKDNPQLIFESMNSKGLELSQSDLIRNFILMNQELDAQNRIYSDYWYPMEQEFGVERDVSVFDRFVRDYLTIKTREIPNMNRVYAEFKNYTFRTNQSDIVELVKDIRRFSKYYAEIAVAEQPRESIQEVVNSIRELKVEVSYPFLMEIFDDFNHNLVSEEELVDVLRLVESYVFRRSVCEIPPNSLNKTFAKLAREIDKSHYVESLRAAFGLMDSYRRFPSDEEFRTSFVAKDFYNSRICDYVLRKLENHDRKEMVEVGDYTKEHIMPQDENVSEEWKAELGPEWQRIHTQFLHTIGNMTLTGYNSEMSNSPFQKKRDMKGGFRDSPIRLNRGLANMDHWNEEEIKKRAESLAELAMTIWPAPVLPAGILDKYRTAKKGSRVETTPPSELEERYILRREFWTMFLERARERGLTILSGRRPSIYYYIAFPSGKVGVNFDFFVHVNGPPEIDVYIDTHDKEKNKRWYDQLYSRKDAIEQEFGGPLAWERLDDARASRVLCEISGVGLKDSKEKWPASQDAMIDMMIRLSKATMPHIMMLPD